VDQGRDRRLTLSNTKQLANRRARFRYGGWSAVALAAGFAAAVVWLPPVAATVLGGLLALSGVVLFARPAWRTASLVVASLLLSFAVAEATFGVLAPHPVLNDVAKTGTPSHWTQNDPIVGYRPRPDTTVEAVAKYGDEVVYHAVYTIEHSGARATPGSRDAGPTYLFVGDSFVFGEGSADAETLPAQFARGLKTAAHVVNLGVPGYAPSHLVRAVEGGLYDPYVVGKVAAVITWIIPQQLPRLSGDGGWLGTSPRFVIDEHGRLQHTGTFYAHWLGDPLAGATYLARTWFASAARAAAPALLQEQTKLYAALIARLKDAVRERYNAPLAVVHFWPEPPVEQEYLDTLAAIHTLGLPMVSARTIIRQGSDWPLYFFPHDGHPNPTLNGRIAQELLKVLDP
jgi:hypothetical protein